MKKLALGLILSFLSMSTFANDTIIFRAMQDELNRSMNDLKFDTFNKPYYIAYRIVDSSTFYTSASLGAVLSQSQSKQRKLIVDLRVGDYHLDSSNVFDLVFRRVSSLLNFNSQVALPIDADYTEIRRKIWLATDSAYKKAVQNLAKKKALLANKNNQDRQDDFLQVKPIVDVKKQQFSDVNANELSLIIKSLSAIGTQHSEIDLSEIDWRHLDSYTRIVDSEGRKISRNDSMSRILMRAEAQTEDGESLFDEAFIYSQNSEGFPSLESLKNQAKQFYQTFAQRTQQPKLKPYVGPILFKPQAAAELVRQTFANQAVAYRAPEKDQTVSIQGFSVNTMQKKIKQRVLPRGFTLSDNPLLTQYKGQDLLGSFEYDDQGVKAENKTLVKNGRLINLLSARTPISEVEVTAGNSLNGGITASNMILNSKAPLSEERLLEEMFITSEELELDYAIVVEKIDSGFSRLNRPSSSIIFGGAKGLTLNGLTAYKLFKNGKKELIRQLQIPNFDIRSFKDIIAAGDDHQVYHAPAKKPGSGFFIGIGNNGNDVTSFIIPSLLFEELSVIPQEGADADLTYVQKNRGVIK